MPVIRPLACMDKTDIIEISKKIDTYETSILPYIDCCTIFTPKNPVTHPKSQKCEEWESKFDYQQYIYDIIHKTEHIYIDENYTPVEDDDVEEFLEVLIKINIDFRRSYFNVKSYGCKRW